jgi:hypothetical protein
MFSLDRGEFLTLEHLVIVQQLAITASFVAVPLDPLRTRAAHVVKLWSIAAVHYDDYEFLLYEQHRVRAMFSDKIISRMGGRSLGAVPC